MVIKDIHNLYEYAFCSTEEGYNKMLSYLTNIAEEEKWSFDETKPYHILKKYLSNTFSQCSKQKKVLISDDGEYSCFNTGLLTPNGDDIIAIFEKNTRDGAQPWILRKFKEKSSRDFLNVFAEVPKLATYTESFQDLYFNPDYNIVVNTDHILDDNWDRIESVLKYPSKNIVKLLLTGVVEEAKKKTKRNLRLVVPQFYKNQIMYLVPITIPDINGNNVTMALAVERTETSQYRANTIFTKEMAYEKARVLMKPESNWLVD